MTPINDILKRVEETNTGNFILSTEDVSKALQKIAPGFHKMQTIVEKSLSQIQQESINNPENAKKLEAILKAEGNVPRYEQLQGKMDNLNEQYSKQIKILESHGLGIIKDMKPDEITILTNRIKENAEIKKSISESLKEFGMTFDDLPKEAKNAIIDKPEKRNTIKYK